MVKKAVNKKLAIVLTTIMLAGAVIPSSVLANSYNLSATNSNKVTISTDGINSVTPWQVPPASASSAYFISASSSSSNSTALTDGASPAMVAPTPIRGESTPAMAGSTSSNGDSAVRSDDGKEAEAKISKAKAEQLVRQYISIPEEYTLQSSYFYTENLIEGKRNVWSLDFAKRVNGKFVGSIYASINADSGQLIQFNSYSYDPHQKPSYPLKVERDQAQKIAESFLKEVAGQYATSIQLNEHYGAHQLPALTGAVRHQFRFDRVVNEIPFVDNYIFVTVDSEGYVVDYSFVWDDTIEFPKVSSYLTLAEAAVKLRELGEPQLKYVVPYGGQEKHKPMLSYHLPTYAIDAITGEKTTEMHYSLYPYYGVNGVVSDVPVTDKPLAKEPVATSLNEQQAIDKVKAAFTIPAEATLQHANFNEYTDYYTDKQYSSWSLYWTLIDNGKESGSIWAAVNGKNGAIQSFNIYHYNAETSSKDELISIEKATNIAVETVKKQLPWLTNELYLVKPDPKQYEQIESNHIENYYINFIRKVHGAEVDYDQVSVNVDARTGAIKGFEAHIQPYDYPSSAPAVITKAAAVENWMDYYRIELTYRVVNTYMLRGEPLPVEKYHLMLAAGELVEEDQMSKKSKVELVYRLVPKQIDESVFLDAQLGDWRSYETGEITQLERPKALDIEGHWAQHQLELMVAYKALDVVDGKVRPNEPIKRGELIKMLVLARNGGYFYGYAVNENSSKTASFADVAVDSQYFAYVESALEQNLIDIGDGSFNPEGTVTREEMAELIVRALGYNTLANVDGIFVDHFKDSAQMTKKGQAAIVVGLKIMSTTNGQFQPQKQVQRAEAATAFFRYLQSRAELQEAPIRM